MIQKMINGKFHLVAALLTGIFFVGCAQPQPIPRDNYYRLGIDASLGKILKSSQPKLNGILEIDRFSADGLVSGRSIVYSKSNKPNQLMEYNYHFWTEPPTILLRDQLIEYLRAAGVAKTIVTSEMRITPDFIISGKIKRFEQVRGSFPHVILDMELGLRRGGTDVLIYWGKYKKKVRATGDTVADSVDASNIALSQLYADYIRDLEK